MPVEQPLERVPAETVEAIPAVTESATVAVEKMVAKIATIFMAAIATVFFKLTATAKVTKKSSMTLWSATRVRVLCKTEPNEGEKPRMACAGMPALLFPDRHKFASSKILTETRGKRKNFDKPKRLNKYPTVVPRKSGHLLFPNTQVRFAVVSSYQW